MFFVSIPLHSIFSLPILGPLQIVIFVAGGLQQDVFSLGYLLFAMYLFFHMKEDRIHARKAWQKLQKYNVFLILIYAVYQVKKNGCDKHFFYIIFTFISRRFLG